MTDDVDGLHVLIVGLNYAPERTGSAPYTAGMAEILAASGATVEVFAGVPHYPAWRVDPAYRKRLRKVEQRNGVLVRHFRHYVPNHQSALARLAWDGTFVANAGLARPRHRPDIVIASTPSLGGAVLGLKAAAATGAGFGIVVQDLVGPGARQSGIRGGAGVSRAVSTVEARVLRRADAVGIVSPAFASQLRSYGVADDRVRVFRNWTHIQVPEPVNRAVMRRKLDWAPDEFVVLHAGNMGLKQDLGNVIEAAKLLSPSARVRFVLCGDGNQRAALEAQSAGVSTISFMPPVDDDDYHAVLSAADLLLVNERPSVGDMALPSKLTSYFSTGRPVLAAVDAGGACATEIAGTDGAGEVVTGGDPPALADAVVRVMADPEALAVMGDRGLAYFSRELGPLAAADRVRRFAADLARATASRRGKEPQ